MPDTPPGTPSPPPPPPPEPKDSQESDFRNPNSNPNLNPTSDSEDPSQNHLPSTSEAVINQPHEEPNGTISVEDQDDPEPDNPELEEGMSVDTVINIDPHENKGNKPHISSVRRSTKRKKGSKKHVNKAASERNMQKLSLGFNPIPFIPAKILDFAKHEELLKKLGLWDFAHVQFDRNIRVDLIGQLIVTYNVKNRGSYVNGFKIGVSRADLGRALKLPKKVECDLEVFPGEFLSFLDEFVSNWMLLHEDFWCTPDEIVNWIKMIKEGNPHKVDWSGLIWYMTEKELTKRVDLKDCYYASHLQQLIKVQKEEWFHDRSGLDGGDTVKETVAVEDDDDDDEGDTKMVDTKESGSVEQKLEEQNVELKLGQDVDANVENTTDDDRVENIANADKVEDVANADKVENVGCCHADESEKIDDFNAMKEENDEVNYENSDVGNKVETIDVDEKKEEDGIKTVKVVDKVEDDGIPEENQDVDMMDYGEYKEEEQGQVQGLEQGPGQGQWFLDGHIGEQHFLQRCSTVEVNASEDTRLEDVGEDVEDEEVEEDGHVEGFKIMSKTSMDAMASANLMQAFETGQLPFSPTGLGGQSSLELMKSRPDNNVMLGGPSMFNHAGNREIDHGHDISHQTQNDRHKRMRVDGNWDNKVPDFGICMENLLQWVEKAKMSHFADMDQAYQQLNMSQHIMEQQLVEKSSEIEELKYKLDNLQRSRQAEVSRLNRELHLMVSVIDGYRMALKQTQKTFSEFRKRTQVPDEPVYRDAALGGVVKSVAELERERFQKEQENKKACSIIHGAFRSILNDCEMKWDGEVLAKIESHNSRLMDGIKEVEQFKDHLIKSKTPSNLETQEDVEMSPIFETQGNIEMPANVETQRDLETQGDVEMSPDVETRGDVEMPADVETRGDVEMPADVETQGHFETPADVETHGDVEMPADVETQGNVDLPVDIDAQGNVEAPANVETPANVEAPANAEAPANVEAPTYVDTTVTVEDEPEAASV
ncbi:unnamed protein product [Amaranthus hypochondriacus]